MAVVYCTGVGYMANGFQHVCLDKDEYFPIEQMLKADSKIENFCVFAIYDLSRGEAP